jgi:biotin operon repressor
MIHDEIARRNSAVFWQKHIQALRSIGFDDDKISRLGHYVKPGNIGTGKGMIRPGELGQWDVFYTLVDSYPEETDRMILAGLTPGQIGTHKLRNEMKARGYDPDNPDDVREYDQMRGVSSDEIEAHIEQLEDLFRGAK